MFPPFYWSGAGGGGRTCTGVMGDQSRLGLSLRRLSHKAEMPPWLPTVLPRANRACSAASRAPSRAKGRAMRAGTGFAVWAQDKTIFGGGQCAAADVTQPRCPQLHWSSVG